MAMVHPSPRQVDLRTPKGALRFPAEQLRRDPASLYHVKAEGLGEVDDVCLNPIRIRSDRKGDLSQTTKRNSRRRLDEARESHSVTIKRLRTSFDVIPRVPHFRAVRNESFVEKVLGAVPILVNQRKNLGGSTGTIKSHRQGCT